MDWLPCGCKGSDPDHTYCLDRLEYAAVAAQLRDECEGEKD